MGAVDRDFRYELRLNGKCLMTGDPSSVGIIFGNLSSRNFKAPVPPWKEQTHEQYRAWMAHFYCTPVEPGMQLTLLSPEGKILSESTVGADLT